MMEMFGSWLESQAYILITFLESTGYTTGIHTRIACDSTSISFDSNKVGQSQITLARTCTGS